LARARGQSLAQMALVWVLRQPAITSALIGASKTSQIEENVGLLKNPTLTPAEIQEIEKILA
jgi:L-glyceraldehyde 3-phosphate reductase